jgi:hypothetical protein
VLVVAPVIVVQPETPFGLDSHAYVNAPDPFVTVAVITNDPPTQTWLKFGLIETEAF